MVLVDADDGSILDRLKGLLLTASVDMLKAATPMWGEDVKSDLVPRPIHNRAAVDLMGEISVWLTADDRSARRDKNEAKSGPTCNVVP